ncbi:MAG: dihydroorotate dehydrogenase electron transfer subunit, partial [Firmicutes bacterium]|nr:dihydroorotate dehydrogenase electron transfer subunit [Bacillota bacterium]
AKEMISLGITIDVVLGFNTKSDVFYVKEFMELGAKVTVCTMDGSVGYHGNTVEAIKHMKIPVEYYYTCGPLKMLQALLENKYQGQLSFEERMGCGFGACMGCSHKTIDSYKRICKEGPVLESSEVYVNV